MQGKADHPKFQDIQYTFTRHVRNPAKNPRPDDVETRRMNIYNDLLYNNVEDFMSSTYPVLREISGDEKWHRLIRDYFEKHRAATPLFLEMPREFLKYLTDERQAEEDDYPFMLELAHYEWVELALSVTDLEPDYSVIDKDTSLLDGVPVLSPLAWPLSYHYPVHEIGPDSLPTEPGQDATHLVVYRDQNDEVHFLNINAVTARMLQMISDENNHLTGREILQDIASQLNHPDPEVVIQGGQQILDDLKDRDVILGVKNT